MWLDLAFLGHPDFQSGGPQIPILMGFGTSGRKTGTSLPARSSNARNCLLIGCLLISANCLLQMYRKLLHHITLISELITFLRRSFGKLCRNLPRNSPRNCWCFPGRSKSLTPNSTRYFTSEISNFKSTFTKENFTTHFCRHGNPKVTEVGVVAMLVSVLFCVGVPGWLSQ